MLGSISASRVPESDLLPGGNRTATLYGPSRCRASPSGRERCGRSRLDGIRQNTATVAVAHAYLDAFDAVKEITA